MKSACHRDNILDKRFEQVGVGTYTDTQGRYWVTEMFLVKREAETEIVEATR